MVEKGYRKLTINLAPEVHDELQRLANERGITITDLIRRAIALDKYVWENRDAELLLRKDGETERIVLISA